MENIFYQLYIVLNSCFIAIMLTFALCFLFLKSPQGDLLRNYRISRRYMALAFFILSITSIAETIVIEQDGPHNTESSLYFTIIGASLVALLLLVALVALINARIINKRWMITELGLITIFSVMIAVSLWLPFYQTYRTIIRFSFCSFFIVQIMRNLWQLLTQHQWARNQLDNYFSGQESSYIQWIKTAWLLCIPAGGLVILMQFYNSWVLYCISDVLILILFTWFAIKMLNYTYIFNLVAPVIASGEEEKTESLPTEELEFAVTRWIQYKRFITPGITIMDVAQDLNTNRTYLSTYINTHKGINFNTWINLLRIEEAQSILGKQPPLSIDEVSEMVGYAHSSSFARQFTKITGTTPSNWRKKSTLFSAIEQ